MPGPLGLPLGESNALAPISPTQLEAWQLQSRLDEDGTFWTKLEEVGRATFQFITDPLQWNAIPYEVRRLSTSVVLKQRGPAESLIRNALLRPQKLGHSDLLRLAKLYQLGLNSRADRRMCVSEPASLNMRF